MKQEEIYQMIMMGSSIVGVGALVYIASSLEEIKDSLRNFYRNVDGLENDLKKAKGLEDKTQE